MTYDYTASALGLGGVLKHPNGTTTYIPSLASVHLAPTGGEGEAEISNYNKDGVSFLNARSSVFGYESGYGMFTSGSDVSIKDLNLFGRIQVTRLQTTVTSTRSFAAGETATQSNPDNARFSMHSVIVGLCIDGIEVIPVFDLELSACLTYEEFRKQISNDSTTYAQQFGVGPAELQNVLATNAQPIRGSFVSALQHAQTDQFGPRKGFKLPVKNFGHVHFGEMIVKPGRRRVNLLRLELDMGLTFPQNTYTSAGTVNPTSTTGSMTILSHDSNGSPSWP
jgi:hypothetical protein